MEPIVLSPSIMVSEIELIEVIPIFIVQNGERAIARICNMSFIIVYESVKSYLLRHRLSNPISIHGTAHVIIKLKIGKPLRAELLF